MKRINTAILGLSILSLSAKAWDSPTMGWSSWNAFGHHISEEIIRSQADALISTGLKDAGYIYVNIDDGAWSGRDENGKLRIHPTRFPNGLLPLIDHIHNSGLKAGTYSDAGHNTCASFWGGDRDGIGTGLYEHDQEDADFMFGELGFDFIKVDFCGGDGPQNSEMLDLDEQERYTAISEAIKATGRSDVRYNVCRWAYPGTWVEDVASSWRMSQDIYLGWESVKDIIHQNLYLSAFATKGRFNDMDMLEVGRGMTEEEDKTHFGMWCMMSSPLLIGCDLREIDTKSIALLSNPELISLNQDPLAVQASVVKREKGGYVLVKDVESMHGCTRAFALYNPTDQAMTMNIDFFDLDLGDEAEIRDLFERKDLGHFSGRFGTHVPAHGTRLFRIEADRRLDRRVYEAETAFLPAYQELDNNQVVKSGIFEENDACSGGAKAGWLGGRLENVLIWRDVWSDDGGEYDMDLRFIAGADRDITIIVNGEETAKLIVNSGSWTNPGSATVKINLNKGINEIMLSNDHDWMPDIDCMILTREGDLGLYRHRHQQALENALSIDLTGLPEKLILSFKDQISSHSNPVESKEGYQNSIDALNKLSLEIEQALTLTQTYESTLYEVEGNISASDATEALTELMAELENVRLIFNDAETTGEIINANELLTQANCKYLKDERALLREGESWNMTCFITNPTFDEDTFGWSGSPVWGSHVAEYWNCTFKVSQTVEGLRDGRYTLCVQALYRQKANDGGNAFRNGTEQISATILANEDKTVVASLYRHPLSETPDLESQLSGTHVLRGFVNSMHGAELAFSHGLYMNEVNTSVKDGKLSISIESDQSEGDCWCCFDNFGLFYHGNDSMKVYPTPWEEEEIVDIFSPTGICVARGIRRSELNTLPDGLYISGGKKIIINHR